MTTRQCCAIALAIVLTSCGGDVGFLLGRNQPDPSRNIIGSMSGSPAECATGDIAFDGKAWRCVK